MPARSFYPAVVLVWVCMMGVLFGASLIYERYPILRNTGAEKQLVPYMFLPSLLIALLVMNLMLFGKPLSGLARRDLWITGIFWVMASLTFGVLIQRLLDPSDPGFLVRAADRTVLVSPHDGKPLPEIVDLLFLYHQNK
jgi:hypothetical protein